MSISTRPQADRVRVSLIVGQADSSNQSCLVIFKEASQFGQRLCGIPQDIMGADASPLSGGALHDRHGSQGVMCSEVIISRRSSYSHHAIPVGVSL